MAVIIQLRRDTAANWTTVNPVLHDGELGIERDTGKAKLGDGSSGWASLAYWQPTGADTDNYDPAGTAASAVAAETARAEAAEALLAPKASPAFTGTVTTANNTLDNGAGNAAIAGTLSMSSNKITSLANGTAATDAAAFGQIPVIDTTASDIQPNGVQAAGNSVKTAAANHVHQNNADLSLLLAPTGATGETFPRTFCGGYTPAATSGQSYVSAIPLPAGLPVNNLAVLLGNTAFATVTHGWLALLDSSRVVKAVTADQTTAFQTSFAALTLATNAYTTTYAGVYYLVWCVVAGTMGNVSSGTVPLSAPAGVAPILSGTSTASMTTPPAVGTTLAAISANGSWRFYGYTA